jgi:hypothetical protein
MSIFLQVHLPRVNGTAQRAKSRSKASQQFQGGLSMSRGCRKFVVVRVGPSGMDRQVAGLERSGQLHQLDQASSGTVLDCCPSPAQHRTSRGEPGHGSSDAFQVASRDSLAIHLQTGHSFPSKDGLVWFTRARKTGESPGYVSCGCHTYPPQLLRDACLELAWLLYVQGKDTLD